MISEGAIYKSMALSLFGSAFLIGLAIHLDWNVADLGKCFYIVIMFSTIHACMLLTLAYIRNLYTPKSASTQLGQAPGTQKKEHLTGKAYPIRTFATATLALSGLLYGAHGITLVGTLIFDGFSASIESWPLRDAAIWGEELLLKTSIEYLPFTSLLFMSLAWDTYRHIRLADELDLFGQIQFKALSYVYLVMSLVFIVIILPMLIGQDALYYILIILAFLPYTNFISIIGQMNAGTSR